MTFKTKTTDRPAGQRAGATGAPPSSLLPDQPPDHPPAGENGNGRELAASAGAGAVPDFLVDAAQEDQGRGVSTDAADNIVPMVYVLQGLSPQVDEQSPQRVAGARPGMFWLRNCPSDPVVPGDRGLLFQPCYFHKEWGRWVPRTQGGGFLGRVPSTLVDGEDQPDEVGAKFSIHDRNKQKVWKDAVGNDLILTRLHAGWIYLGESLFFPYVIPFRSTGHTTSRNWMFTMMSKRTKSGLVLPSFAALYRLTTRQRKNSQGTWYVVDVADAGWVSPDQYARGRSLADAFASGEKRAEDEVTGVADDAPPSDGAPPPTGDEIPF